MTEIADERFEELLSSLERIAGGDLDHRVALSERHDEVDAIGHAINVLVGELQIMAKGLRRAKEEAEAASRAKTAFIRNVSHEIRTPLSVILGMSELIATGKLPESRAQDLHKRIASNGRALVDILDDLLDLAKIEAEKLDFDLRPASVADVTAEVVSSFEPEAARKGLRVLMHKDDEERNLHAIADRKRLRQILTNVIGNAVKFTSRGEISVVVGRSSDARRVVVDVKDTGIGLSADQRRTLFEPFVQADESIGRRFGGSGLGLALSKRFAAGMGGALEVLESELGVGTTFRLSLPAARPVDVREGDVLADDVTQSPTALRGLRILVVEDNDDVRTATTELLRAAGAIVGEASNGQEAIERSHEATFDVILMDLRMPVMDGLEATRRLRAEGVAVPIVALTADAVSEQKTACLDAGCTAFLLKPIELEKLVAALSDRATLS